MYTTNYYNYGTQTGLIDTYTVSLHGQTVGSFNIRKAGSDISPTCSSVSKSGYSLAIAYSKDRINNSYPTADYLLSLDVYYGSTVNVDIGDYSYDWNSVACQG
ncbi:MAG: hypothetical protein GY821_08480 [Gammaproteobacteria bacterium]|nr:hypothetical protein [Gammaproteobacteria bacterium]